MKPLTAVLALLVGALGLNLLTWAGWGRESILLEAASLNDETCPFGYVDTLHVQANASNRHVDTEGSSSISDFSLNTRDRLVRRLADQPTYGAVLYREGTIEMSDDHSGDVRIAAFVDRRIPLYANTSIFYYSSGVAGWSQRWIWFLGWRRLGAGNAGCS